MQYLIPSLAFLKRIGIAMLMFSACRLIFYLFNFSFFSGFTLAGFIHGLRFDLSAIAYTYSPFILLSAIPFHLKQQRQYQILLKFLFHLSNTSALLFNCIDFEYFKFTFKRTTSDLFFLSGLGKDIASLLPRFIIDYWYIVLIFLFLVFISELLYRKTMHYSSGRFNMLKSYLTETAIFIAVLSGFVISARGGFQLRPITIINANEYSGPQNIPLVLNTPFTIIKTFFDRGITEKKYMPPEEVENYFNPVLSFNPRDSFRYHNVVLIILESFSNEYLGIMNPEIKRATFTPFLDSIAKHALVFNRCYANGKKSIEGIPAIVASLPSLMNNPFISSPYAANTINSLATLLKGKGYQTAFFHGGTNGTMGFDVFTEAAGFDKYYGRTEYNNEADYDGHWGIWDEEFYNYFAQTMNTLNQPFFTCFFSLSSHHPFIVPARHEGKFTEGKLKIHKSIQYADYSLKQFFETASKTPWFNNTLFVITADHTSTNATPFFTSSAGIYAIPLIFYSPGHIKPGIRNTVTQQTDIMPSILEYLHYKGDCIAFGKSCLNDSTEGFALNYVNNIYQLITDSFVLHFDGEETTRLYNYKNDQLLKNNILASDSNTAHGFELKIKAMIQSYNQRLINNRLTVDK